MHESGCNNCMVGSEIPATYRVNTWQVHGSHNTPSAEGEIWSLYDALEVGKEGFLLCIGGSFGLQPQCTCRQRIVYAVGS